jgi:hypothetical protein
MKSSFWSSPGRNWRALGVFLLGVFCLSGADCGSGSQETTEPAPTLVGNSANGVPPASAEDTFISLLNSQVRFNQTPVVQDPLGTSVAKTHSDWMASTGNFTAVMDGQDFGTRLLNAGVAPPIDVQPVLARAYSSPQTLITAILANPTALIALRRNVTRIGVSLGGPANGNYWTILIY